MTKFGTFCLMATKSEDPYQRLNAKLKIGKQMNALADYAKRIFSELALFDRALLHQINVSLTSGQKNVCVWGCMLKKLR